MFVFNNFVSPSSLKDSFRFRQFRKLSDFFYVFLVYSGKISFSPYLVREINCKTHEKNVTL